MAFRWSQNTSSVTITFPVPGTTKKGDVDVSVVNTSLRAGVKGSVPLCEGTLTSPVKGFKWSLKANTVSIQLEKTVKVKWNDLLVPGRCKARVLFDYTSRDPVELTVHVGDIITVLNEDSSGWWKGDLNGKIGLFPSNFTEIIEAQQVPEGPEETEPAFVPTPAPVAQQPPVAQPPPPTEAPTPVGPPPGAARVPLIASNGAMMELRNKLATRANTVVSLEEAERASVREAPAPTPAPAPIRKADPATTASSSGGTVKKEPKPGVLATARALYDYAAVEEGELTFAEGSRVDILLRDDSGWWQGQVGDAVGWFPAEYVSEVKESLPPLPAGPPATPVPAPEPKPVPVPVPQPTNDASGSNEEEANEDDVIDISNTGANRLVVPRRPMGSSVRRMPSKATLQRSTAKALANTSSSNLLENGEPADTPAPAPTPAPTPAHAPTPATPLSPTPSSFKPRPPPPGSKKPPPPKALPASPADNVPTTSPTPTPTSTPTPTPPVPRVQQPRPTSPTAQDDTTTQEEPVQADPSPPKPTIVKRPPPPGGVSVRPLKVMAKKPAAPSPSPTPAPASDSAATEPTPPPVATPTPTPNPPPPTPTKLRGPASDSTPTGTPEKVAPTQTNSSSSLSNSSGSVPPPSTSTGSQGVTPRKIIKPPPPTNFTKQLSSTDSMSAIPTQAATPAPTPQPPAVPVPVTTTPPTASPPPNVTPPPSHSVNALNLSSNNLLSSSSSKWPPHLGTFQEFCDQLTTLLSEDHTDITASGSIAQLSPRTRMRASVGMCSVDGHVFVHGGGGEWGHRHFPLGAVSLPFAYYAAVEAVGAKGVNTVVSKDGPRADTFSEIPHPFSTAGSIALCGKLVSANINSSPVPSAVPTSKLLTLLSSLAGHHLSTNITSFLTLRATSHGDTAIAHFLKAKGHLDANVNPADALDVHLALKSTEVDVRNGSILAASLAANGVCPTNRQTLVPHDTATSVVGMLPKVNFGDDHTLPGWVIDNAVVLVVPNVMGLVVHADDSGRAQLVAKVIAEKLKMIQ